MNHEVLHNRDERKFYMVIDGVEAHMMYRETDSDTFNFYHTYVPDQLRGRKIAGKIVKAAVEFAKGEGKKIVPGCSYVRRFLEREVAFSELIRE